MDCLDVNPTILAAVGWLIFSVFSRLMRARKQREEAASNLPMETGSAEPQARELPEAVRIFLEQAGIELPKAPPPRAPEPQHDDDFSADAVTDADDLDYDDEMGAEPSDVWGAPREERESAEDRTTPTPSWEQPELEGVATTAAVFDERDEEHAAHWRIKSAPAFDWSIPSARRGRAEVSNDARTEWRDAMVLSMLLNRQRGRRR